MCTSERSENAHNNLPLCYVTAINRWSASKWDASVQGVHKAQFDALNEKLLAWLDAQINTSRSWSASGIRRRYIRPTNSRKPTRLKPFQAISRGWRNRARSGAWPWLAYPFKRAGQRHHAEFAQAEKWFAAPMKQAPLPLIWLGHLFRDLKNRYEQAQRRCSGPASRAAFVPAMVRLGIGATGEIRQQVRPQRRDEAMALLERGSPRAICRRGFFGGRNDARLVRACRRIFRGHPSHVP